MNNILVQCKKLMTLTVFSVNSFGALAITASDIEEEFLATPKSAPPLEMLEHIAKIRDNNEEIKTTIATTDLVDQEDTVTEKVAISTKSESRDQVNFSGAILQILNAAGNAKLLGTPKKIATVTPDQLRALLNKTFEGKIYAKAAPPFKCALNVYSYRYTTVGGAGEPTDSSGVIMLPTGADPVCNGPRPVVLFAHGTAPTTHYDLAQINDINNDANDEALIMAAYFGSQGYITMGPNYAGYNGSKLDYHPYLNAKQQSSEMIDSLKTGIQGVEKLIIKGKERVAFNDRIFVSGYSQGGYVGMATLQEMQSRGLPVTAGATLSGPYALSAFGDRILKGEVAVGASLFVPMMVTSYQKAYGNIYKDMKDIYSEPYSHNPEVLFPTNRPVIDIYKSGELPITQIFQKSPTKISLIDNLSPPSKKYFYGFASQNYLVNTDYRFGYIDDMTKNPDWGEAKKGVKTDLPAAPQNTFRQALKLNDLRDYTPTMPVMMCGGHRDPTVNYYVDSGLMTRILAEKAKSGVPVKFVSIDVDDHNRKLSDIYTSYGISPSVNLAMADSALKTQRGFKNTMSNVVNGVKVKARAKGRSFLIGEVEAIVMVLANYHVNFALPYCAANATTFFNQYQ